nr:hypothetical protein [Tanacetum cinerariifolium]
MLQQLMRHLRIASMYIDLFEVGIKGCDTGLDCRREKKTMNSAGVLWAGNFVFHGSYNLSLGFWKFGLQFVMNMNFFQDFLNTFESSDDDSNVVSIPQEPVVFNQDPSENSSQSPPQIDYHCCYGCSNSLDESSVENLVPNPSESEDEYECDVPACDEFTTFSNLIFDADDDFSSSDNESFSDEDIPKEICSNPLFNEEIISFKIDPHYLNVESNLIESLLNQYSLIISSSKIDSLLDEFASELILLKSIPPGINEADYDPNELIRLINLLYDNSSTRPPKEFISENSDAAIESFSPSLIPVEDSYSLKDEIYLTLTPDDSMPPSIEDDDYDSERDILEEFLSNDSL